MCKLPSWLAGWFAFQFLTFFGCTSVLHSKVSPDDHPLVVQFAANDPAILLDAALWAQDVPMSFQQFLIGVCLCNVFTRVLPETWSGCRGPEFGLPTMVTRHCIASVFLLGGTVVWKNHERTVKGRKKKDSSVWNRSVWNRNYVPTWDVHVVHVMLVRKAKQGASCLIPQSS